MSITYKLATKDSRFSNKLGLLYLHSFQMERLPCWFGGRCPSRRRSRSFVGRGKNCPSHETGMETHDGRTDEAPSDRPTTATDRPMSVFFPDRPTTNNGRQRGRMGGGRTGRRRANREATLNARFAADRKTDRATDRASNRPRHSAAPARIMLYFTLWHHWHGMAVVAQPQTCAVYKSLSPRNVSHVPPYQAIPHPLPLVPSTLPAFHSLRVRVD